MRVRTFVFDFLEVWLGLGLGPVSCCPSGLSLEIFESEYESESD